MGKILKPINTEDKAFVVNVFESAGMPPTKPWVRFLNKFWRDFGDKCTIENSHEAELRLFVVSKQASFEEISRETERLISIGFRPTTLRHLVGFCNNENAKDLASLNEDIVFITSSNLMKNIDGKQSVKVDGFYSALLRKEGMIVGTVESGDLSELPTIILLLEVPLQQ